MDNLCPHCQGAPCLPLWRKLITGPTSSARCQVCGYKVGVEPMRALLVMLPLLLLAIGITAGLLTDAITAVLLLVIFLPICGALYAYWVPLSPREITDRRLVEAARARIASEKKTRQSG